MVLCRIALPDRPQPFFAHWAPHWEDVQALDARVVDLELLYRQMTEDLQLALNFAGSPESGLLYEGEGIWKGFFGGLHLGGLHMGVSKAPDIIDDNGSSPKRPLFEGNPGFNRPSRTRTPPTWGVTSSGSQKHALFPLWSSTFTRQ